jgi:hypothetical protein
LAFQKKSPKKKKKKKKKKKTKGKGKQYFALYPIAKEQIENHQA